MQDPIFRVCIVNEDRHIVTCTKDQIKIWDLNDATCAHTMKFPHDSKFSREALNN